MLFFMTTELAADGKPFVHQQAAHCETGVTSALFRHQGVDISEPMVFGIGSGIFSAICRLLNFHICRSLLFGLNPDRSFARRPKGWVRIL